MEFSTLTRTNHHRYDINNMAQFQKEEEEKKRENRDFR